MNAVYKPCGSLDIFLGKEKKMMIVMPYNNNATGNICSSFIFCHGEDNLKPWSFKSKTFSSLGLMLYLKCIKQVQKDTSLVLVVNIY